MMLRVGDRVLVEEGNMSGPTTEGVQYRIDQCKEGCTFEDFDKDCPRVMIVPVVKPVNSKEVEIRGLLSFSWRGSRGREMKTM